MAKLHNKKIGSILLIVTLLITGCSSSSYSKAISFSKETTNSISSTDYVEGEALILLREDAIPSGSISSSSLEKNMDLPTGVNVDSISKVKGISKQTKKITKDAHFTSSDYVATISSDSLSTKELLAKLDNQDEIAYAEPNYRYHINTANDPYYKDQWGINPNSTVAGSSQSDIKLSQITSEPITTNAVVVMDTGVNSNHEDLKGKVLQSYGYNAITGVYSGEDDNGHGTHCAGTIAAASNNQTGISGICPTTSIISVKVMDADGSGSGSNLVSGLNYVQSLCNSGVKVRAINMSFGGFGYSTLVLSAINTLGEKNNVVCSVSSGNDGEDITTNTSYPASYNSPYIVCVAASTPTKELAYFSDYSLTSVDVAAPGTNILSCSNEESYNGELTRDGYYENFDSMTSGDSFGTASGGTLSITSSKNYSPVASGSTGQSLCWTIQATAGQTYSLTLPYTLATKTGANRYASMYIYMDADSSSQSESTAKLCAYDASTSLLTRSYFDGMYLSSTNYWNLINGKINNTTTNKSVVLKLLQPKSTTYRIYIDSFATGYETSFYDEDYGSSMAAPFVTAEAALLASIYPEETGLSIAGRIKGGVDPVSSMTGKISSGGIINYLKAAYAPGPSISEVTISGKKLTIKGCHLDDKSASNITVNGILLPVISWSKDTIVLDASSITDENITITITTPNGTFTQVAKITPYIFPSSISLSNKTKKLKAGTSFFLTSSVSPTNAVDKSIIWSSSNEKYVTVSSKGEVTAKSAGKGKTVIITASSKDKSSVTATCKVTVIKYIKKITLKKKKLNVKAGKKVTLKTTISPKTATNKKLSYSSSNKKYASVSKKGVVTTKKAGKGKTVTITIKAKDGSKKKTTCTIHIK